MDKIKSHSLAITIRLKRTDPGHLQNIIEMR